MWETAEVLDRKNQTPWKIKTYEGILTLRRKTSHQQRDVETPQCSLFT